MAKKNSINNKSGSLIVDPGAPENSFIQFDINGTGEYRVGADRGDGDKFKISQGSALGTNDLFVIHSTGEGETILPSQSAFSAIASDQSSVTGDGTSATITFNGSESFDQNGDFNGTDFIAPVTGKYHFNASVMASEITSSHNVGWIRLATSNRDYTVGWSNPALSRNLISSPAYSFHFSLIVDMDAADTAHVELLISSGGKTVDIVGVGSVFDGYLVC